MADTIFVSWSKQPSGDLALLVRKWLANLLPTCKPFFSREIVKGREGDVEIKKGLGGASFGVLCVTRNNVGEKWLLFEAGALYNRFETSEDTRVAPILFDVEVGEVGAPLSKLQCVTFNEGEMLDLALAINAVLAPPFETEFVREQFKRLWPDLQASVSDVLAKAQVEGAVSEPEQPSIKELHEALLRQGEMMQEVYRWVTQQAAVRAGSFTTDYDSLMRVSRLLPSADTAALWDKIYLSIGSKESSTGLSEFLALVQLLKRVLSELESSTDLKDKAIGLEQATALVHLADPQEAQLSQHYRDKRATADVRVFATALAQFRDLKERVRRLQGG